MSDLDTPIGKAEAEAWARIWKSVGQRIKEKQMAIQNTGQFPQLTTKGSTPKKPKKGGKRGC